MDEVKDAEFVVSLMLRMRACVRKYKSHSDDGGKIFTILGSLRDYETRTGRPVTVSEIARHSGLALPNVSRLLKPLEEDGYIRREKQGRTVSVIITAKGEHTLMQHRKEFISDVAEALGALSDEERKIFLTCNEKMLAQLEKKTENLIGR